MNTDSDKKFIGVLGAGTWGIALSRMLSNTGHRVTVWSALSSEIDSLSSSRRQPNLPDMVIPDEIIFTKSIEEACTGKDVILIAVPSIFVKNTARSAAPYLDGSQIIVSVAKGMDSDTLSTMTQVIRAELNAAGKGSINIVALSGPTHAEEVARDLPTAIVAACENRQAAEYVQDVFMNENLRVYTNPDIEGVEICGAMKNVIALAVGISTGLGYQDNARAALITRGMEEIRRLGLALGCDERTFRGLAGIGDLIVTASSGHSRNNRCGQLIGKGYSVDDAVKEVGMVVEGLNALPTVLALARKYGIDVPIASAVGKIVFENADPADIGAEVMARDKKAENDNSNWK